MSELSELRLAVSRLAERLDKLAPEPPPSPEKLALVHDIQIYSQCHGRVAAWRMYKDSIDGKLTEAEFQAALQG